RLRPPENAPTARLLSRCGHFLNVERPSATAPAGHERMSRTCKHSTWKLKPADESGNLCDWSLVCHGTVFLAGAFRPPGRYVIQEPVPPMKTNAETMRIRPHEASKIG